MDAAIALKSLELLAGEVRAQAAMQEASFVRAGSDLAVCAAWVEVERIRATTLAGEVLRVATPASCFRAQTFTRVERGPVMVAGSAVESARCQ
jgi:hypothetical protein